ncbi:MAG TPA: ATP-binding protein [Dongiaceae bacterium]|jgi:signal transduction histidine kinase/ActR/RegA family two-component response regulator|nr:ATP-binding protein [Dongiaceae bacterium]
MNSPLSEPAVTDAYSQRVKQLFDEQWQSIIRHTDQLFLWLMIFQWFFAVALALWVSPRAWSGMSSTIHPHVWLAIFLGGIITSAPVLLAWRQPGKALTRHVVAVGQMLMSSLLIHLTGGRIETHFHVFGSLAILAFYRDWRVMVSASVVVYVDHLLRGYFIPQSVYGVLSASIWRSFEHAGWVAFEVIFLIIAILKSLQEMLAVAERQAKLEKVNETIERAVTERTAELTREIVERRQAQEKLLASEAQLLQSQKMEAVGRLAGGVAHDFNNMLMVINGYTSMALQQMDAANPLRKHMEETLKASDRATALTRQLLAFSRKQVLQPRVLDLKEVIVGMEKMLRRLIGEHVELHTVFDPALGHVKADPGQIEQVILNMVINARDAMPDGGTVTIRTANVSIDQKTSFRNRELEIGEYVMLSISDTGIGMSQEITAHLFEPFFTTKGIGKGTGLGLATSYGIICQSGGDVRVYSEPGSGTTFKIYLPHINAPLDSAPTSDSEESSDGTESLLVVEDDKAVRAMIVSSLRERGYRVHEAANVPEALPLLDSRTRFDLVITDVIMPKMSGKDLYDHVKKNSPELKVLFISGYTDDVLANSGVLDEGGFFLEKPFSPVKLARKVRAIIDGMNEETRHRRRIVTDD